MKVSAGIIINTNKGWLVGHCTHGTHWDFPKGRVDEGEDHRSAAVRELQEETGIVLTQEEIDSLVDFGQHSYIKGKDLHLFFLNKEVDVSTVICESMVPVKVPFPELDKFMIMNPLDKNKYLSKGMISWVDKNISSSYK